MGVSMTVVEHASLYVSRADVGCFVSWLLVCELYFTESKSDFKENLEIRLFQNEINKPRSMKPSQFRNALEAGFFVHLSLIQHVYWLHISPTTHYVCRHKN
jgi:hypothetical protein